MMFLIIFWVVLFSFEGMFEFKAIDVESNQPIKNVALTFWAGDSLVHSGFTDVSGMYLWTNQANSERMTDMEVKWSHEAYFGGSTKWLLLNCFGCINRTTTAHLHPVNSRPIQGSLVSFNMGEPADSLAYYEWCLTDRMDLEFTGYLISQELERFSGNEQKGLVAKLASYTNLTLKTISAKEYEEILGIKPSGVFYMEKAR